MDGTISLGGARVSYASQEPWLFVATVRENILFGLPYDRIRYNKVLIVTLKSEGFCIKLH